MNTNKNFRWAILSFFIFLSFLSLPAFPEDQIAGSMVGKPSETEGFFKTIQETAFDDYDNRVNWGSFLKGVRFFDLGATLINIEAIRKAGYTEKDIVDFLRSFFAREFQRPQKYLIGIPPQEKEFKPAIKIEILDFSQRPEKVEMIGFFKVVPRILNVNSETVILWDASLRLMIPIKIGEKNFFEEEVLLWKACRFQTLNNSSKDRWGALSQLLESFKHRWFLANSE